MKLGIIIDSAAGLNQKETLKKGWEFIPLHMFIDNVDYKDGIDLDTNNVFDILTIDSDVRTSATAPGEVIEVFDKASKKYDHVIVYSLSTKLSSQNNNLRMISNDYENIHVIDSLSVADSIIYYCETLEQMAKDGKSIEEILNYANKTKNDSFTILVPETLDWLVKGGRVNSNIAAMAKMLKIVPQIAVDNGELSKFGKGRTFDKTILKSARAVIEKTHATKLVVAHANNKDVNKYVEMIEKEFNVEVELKTLPPVIMLHVGLGAIGILGLKK